MKTYTFKVVIEPDEDALGNHAWHATCPALLGAASSGRTKEAALRNINEVIQIIIQEFAQEGKPIPEGPADEVEVTEISHDSPRIVVTL